MTEYGHSVTVISPVAFVTDLNQLSGCWGRSMADAGYFGDANYTDGVNDYCVRHSVVTAELLSRPGRPLERPSFDADEGLDLGKAQSAKNKIEVVEVDVENPPSLDLTKITYVIDREPHSILKA